MPLNVSSGTKKTITFIVGVVVVTAIAIFVAAGNQGPSATPKIQHTPPTVRLVNGKIQNGMWTDAQAARWLKSDQERLRREGQAFVLAGSSIQLESPLPITLAYYDLDITDGEAYDPGATNSTRNPTLTPWFYYDGSKQLKISFPPAEAPKTCKYRVVVFVGFVPQGSEAPRPGTLVSSSERVLYITDEAGDEEVQRRCNPSPTSVRPS